MNEVLTAVILLLLAAGLGMLWWGRRWRRATGLPAGTVVYSDTGKEEAVLAPLVSHRHGLVGKPDYLVEVSGAGRRLVVPLEVKSRKQPPVPDSGHLLQLADLLPAGRRCLRPETAPWLPALCRRDTQN